MFRSRDIAYDSTVAGPLLEDQLPPDSFVVGDKACDAEWIRSIIDAQDTVPVIPDRGTARTSHAFDRRRYAMRNRIERLFNKVQQFRRIPTRYEKLAANFQARCSALPVDVAKARLTSPNV